MSDSYNPDTFIDIIFGSDADDDYDSNDDLIIGRSPTDTLFNIISTHSRP